MILNLGFIFVIWLKFSLTSCVMFQLIHLFLKRSEVCWYCLAYQRKGYTVANILLQGTVNFICNVKCLLHKNINCTHSRLTIVMSRSVSHDHARYVSYRLLSVSAFLFMWLVNSGKYETVRLVKWEVCRVSSLTVVGDHDWVRIAVLESGNVAMWFYLTIITNIATSHNQRSGSAGEIDARCWRVNESLTKVYLYLW